MSKLMKKCLTKYCRNKAAHHRRFCEKCRSRRTKQINPYYYHFNALRNNAKRRGKPFNLTLAEFKIFCANTGYMDLKGRSLSSATIDRIRDAEGYSFNNIQVLSNGENVTKQRNLEKVPCPF
jgi:hypothetical protein